MPPIVPATLYARDYVPLPLQLLQLPVPLLEPPQTLGPRQFATAAPVPAHRTLNHTNVESESTLLTAHFDSMALWTV